MRKIGLAMMMAIAAGFAVLGSTPAAARDYPWCIQGGGWGYPGECSYATYEQCLASASGRYVACGPNPAFAFDRARRGHPPHPRPHPYDR